MRSRQSFFRLCCCFTCVICLFISISGFNASAADDIYIGNTTTLDVATSRLIFGDSIPGTYFNGQTYEDCTFIYEGSVSSSAVFDTNDFYDPNGYLTANGDYQFLLYRAPIIPANDSTATFTVKLQPQLFTYLSINYMSVSCGLCCAASDSQLYGSGESSWSYAVDGIDYSASALYKDQNGGYSGIGISVTTTLAHGWNMYFRPINIILNNATSFSFTSGNITFQPQVVAVQNVSAAEGGGVYFYLTTPTVSEGAVWDNPFEDDDDTGLLTTIKNGVLSIIDSIANLPSNVANFVVNGVHDLFVPSQADLEEFHDDLDTALKDSFGAAYESEELLKEGIDSILDEAAPDATIYFPGISFREHVLIAPQDVVIKPSGMNYLFDTLAMVGDLVATLAVVNMVKHRFEKVVLENDG